LDGGSPERWKVGQKPDRMKKNFSAWQQQCFNIRTTLPNSLSTSGWKQMAREISEKLKLM